MFMQHMLLYSSKIENQIRTIIVLLKCTIHIYNTHVFCLIFTFCMICMYYKMFLYKKSSPFCRMSHNSIWKVVDIDLFFYYYYYCFAIMDVKRLQEVNVKPISNKQNPDKSSKIIVSNGKHICQQWCLSCFNLVLDSALSLLFIRVVPRFLYCFMNNITVKYWFNVQLLLKFLKVQTYAANRSLYLWWILVEFLQMCEFYFLTVYIALSC